MKVEGWDRNIRALLTPFAGVAGNVKVGQVDPDEHQGVAEPLPGKLPASGVKPWMYFSFHASLVWVSRYWT